MFPLVLAAAVQAAVSQVTVYGDRARVERVAEAQVEGSARVELPLLPDSIDSSSIRVQASGGPEVQRIDVQHVEPDEFPVDAARKLLTALDQQDDRIRAAESERDAVRLQLATLSRLRPEVKDDPLKPRPKLNPKGWAEALRFTESEMTPLRAKVRDAEQRLIDLRQEREKLAEQARLLGGAQRRSGWRVVAHLAGTGTAKLSVTYMARNATWVPEYALQLQADQKTVRVWFGGTASQETGEDWANSALTLSTAVPATARALPEIATWKIGEKERFIPTPVRQGRIPPPEPLPAPQPVDQRESEADRVRQQLMARVEAPPEAPSAPKAVAAGNTMYGGPPPPSRAAPPAPARGGARAEKKASRPAAAPPPEEDVGQALAMPAPMMEATARQSAASAPRQPVEQVPGLSPPASFRPDPLPPDAPNALAGGYDLEFPSTHRETLKSGEAARKVSLFSESWPVTTERLLFPALSDDAYLVAQLKNPSQRTLPRGRAQLMVGKDPAGTADLPLVSPGEEITLPLGIDRAIKPFRNVAQVQSEKGIFSKDDVTRYEVTIEVANPYPAPVAMRVVDQLPIAGDKETRIEDANISGAEIEEGTGKLTWKVTAPARGKTTLKFAYTLRRPKGYKVHQ